MDFSQSHRPFGPISGVSGKPVSGSLRTGADGVSSGSGGDAAPVNTVAPVISGTLVVGEDLSVTTGTWTGTPTITYEYQWRRNNSDIGGATSSTYTLVQADAGNVIDCVVTATNGVGSDTATADDTTAIYDADANTYLDAVETADTEALESGVRLAVNAFVIGCKSDAIWEAIKASCIMAGAKTLSGALVPLVGAAPTNNNFVGGDYSRTAGLAGNGTTKNLDTNRANNADPQNSKHIAVYRTTSESRLATMAAISAPNSANATSTLLTTTTSRYFRTNWVGTPDGLQADTSTTAGFWGGVRASGTSMEGRYAGSDFSYANTGGTLETGNICVFSRGATNFSNAVIAFYSVGEALDLELLDTRVTTLISAIGAALA